LMLTRCLAVPAPSNSLNQDLLQLLPVEVERLRIHCYTTGAAAAAACECVCFAV
jgi:hypothetical protein